MKFLRILNSNLSEIKRDDLREYSEFVQLSFSYNEIEFLPGDLFADMRNLEIILFNGNKLEKIDPNLLDGLNKLKFVSFRNNPCIDKCYDRRGVHGNATLDSLKLEISSKNSKPSTPLVRKINKNNNEKCSCKSDKKCCNGVWLDLKQIMMNEKFKDFTVIVNEEKFKVHKFVFAACSAVLTEIIENNIEAESLNLTDISTETFRTILNFIYTDEMPQPNYTNFIQLYAAAGRLKIEKLKNFAAEKLIDEINENNAIEILALADKYENKNLHQKSFQEIKKILCAFKIRDDLAMEPEKLKNLLQIKKKKDVTMKVMNEKFTKMFNKK